LELFYDPAGNPTDLELLQQAQEIARIATKTCTGTAV